MPAASRDADLEDGTINMQKAMFPQVGRLGLRYSHWVHAPSTQQFRMFETDFMEFFAKTQWWAVPLVWLPTVVGFAASAMVCDISQPAESPYQPWCPSRGVPVSGPACLALFFLGILLWTFLEYLIHRFLFHSVVSTASPFWITAHFVLHGQHHKFPMDKGRLVFPPAATLVAVSMFYSLFLALMPLGQARALAAGTLFGYIIYDMIHYYVHHGKSVPSFLAAIKKAHMSHHFKDINSGLWIKFSE